MKQYIYVSFFILFLAGFLIAFFSYNTVWLGDDINYGYNIKYPEKAISSFQDILESQNYHYLTANGRYLAHVLVQGFCGLWGHWPFAIANGLVYIYFFILVNKLCDISIENWRGVLSIVLLGLITFQTKMMPSCQIGFVWMFSLTLSLLIIFFSKRSYPVWISIISGLFAIIIGNGQEALNLGVSAALFFYWLKNMRRMTFMQYCLMIGFWLGTLSNGISPGSLHRGGGSVNSPANRLFFNFFTFIFYWRATWFMIAVVAYRAIKNNMSWVQIYSLNKFYWNGIIILFIFNAFIGFQYNRAAFGIELLALIIGMRMLPEKTMNYFWTIFFGIWLCVNYVFQGIGIFQKKDYVEKVEKLYSQSMDGVVYIDSDFSNPIPESRRFSGVIVPYGVTNGGDYSFYEYRMLAKYLKNKYPGRPKIRIVPTYLEDKENADMGNQLIYLGNDLWLAIQSKTSPAKFEVYRSFPIFSFIKKYEPEEVDMQEENCIVAEGETWRARYIAEIDHHIHNHNFTSDVVMIEPSNSSH